MNLHRNHWSLSQLTTLLAIIHAVPAHACAVCFQAKEGSRLAHYGTTVAMLLLPLIIISSFVFWLRRRLAVMAEEEQAERDASAAASDARVVSPDSTRERYLRARRKDAGKRSFD